MKNQNVETIILKLIPSSKLFFSFKSSSNAILTYNLQGVDGALIINLI